MAASLSDVGISFVNGGGNVTGSMAAVYTSGGNEEVYVSVCNDNNTSGDIEIQVAGVSVLDKTGAAAGYQAGPFGPFYLTNTETVSAQEGTASYQVSVTGKRYA